MKLNPLHLRRLSWILTAAPMLCAPESGSASEDSSLYRWATQDYMLGNWGGLRDDLSRHGVDFEFFYAGSNPNNVEGGLREGGVYQGALLMALDVDSQKLANYPGGSLHVSGLWLHGHKPFSDDYLGDLNKVNLLDLADAARFWEVSYQQKLFDGKLSLKLGKLSVDRDFIVPDLYNSLGQLTLLNQTFFYPTLAFDLYDIPGLPPRNHALPSTPNSSLGAVIRWQPTATWHLQAGVYDDEVDQSFDGTRFDLGGGDGALAYFELGARFNQATNRTGLEGSIKLGAWVHTGHFVDVYEGVNWAFADAVGLPAPEVKDHEGTFGLYFLAEQQLYREKEKTDPAKEGLLSFFRATAAPADRSLAQWGVDGGLIYKGLIPSRDWDSLALAVSYLSISDDLRRAQNDVNQWAPGAFVVADYETALEVSYHLQATAWWAIQPSLQYVIHPGGSGATPDATVVILQTTFRF